jgi:hypothetical protein
MTESRRASFAALAIIIATSMIISTSMCLSSTDAGPNDIIYINNADDLARIGTGIVIEGTEWSLDATYIQQNDISLADRAAESLTITFATGPTWGDYIGQSCDHNIYVTVTSDYPLSSINCELHLNEDTVHRVTADSIPAIDRDDAYYYSFLRLYMHDGEGSTFDITLDIPFIPDYEGYDSTGEYRNMKDFSMTETYNCNLFPIGGKNRPFTGTYDGKGYTINGLNQEITFGSSLSGLPNYLFNEDLWIHDIYAGLFAYISNGMVFDLGLTGGSIDLKSNASRTAYYANLNVGGIAGSITDGTYIYGCYNQNTLSATSTNELRGCVNMGGIVGYSNDYYSNYGGMIGTCFNAGDLRSSIGMSYIGGIIGYDLRTSIYDCYNVGDITCIVPFTHKNSALGGLAGVIADCEILNCYNRGDITGYVFGFPDIWPCNSFIGGLAGDCLGGMYFTNCYSTGSIGFVEAPYRGDDVFHNDPWTVEEMENQDSRPYLSGGVIGHLSGHAYITNCYYLEDLELFGNKDPYYDFTLDGVYVDTYDPARSDLRKDRPSGNKTESELKNQDQDDENFPYYTGDTVMNDDYVPGWDFGTIQTESSWSFDLYGYNDGYPILTMFLGEIYVAISPEDSGTIDTTEFYSTFEGDIEAIPSEGFSFKEWETGETNRVRSLNIPHWRQYISLTADFVRSYKITAVADDGSYISDEGENFVAPDGSITFEFGVSEGYDMTVLVDGEPLDQERAMLGTYTFQNVAGEHTIRVISQIKTYSITAAADNNSMIDPSSTVVDHGGSITFKFGASEGFEVATVLIDGDPLEESQVALGEYTFSNVDCEHSISVTSQVKKYLIFAEADNGSKISPSSTSVDPGSSITFKFNALPGCRIISVYVDDDPLEQNLMDLGEYTFSNINSEHSISVESEAVWYIISAEADSNSVITPAGYNTVYSGNSLVFKFSALQGYRIAAVYVDGDPLRQSQIDLGTYTFSNVNDEHSISVRSERITVTVSATADEGSTISPGSTRVPYGGSVTFEFGAKDGYVLKDVIIDGSSRSDLIDAGTYTFANVNMDHSIDVVSEEVVSTVILTVNTSGSGAITYSIDGGEILQYTSPIEVAVGSSVTLYAAGTDDFVFSNWIVDGETIDSSTVTISDIEASAVISVVFSIPEADDDGG